MKKVNGKLVEKRGRKVMDLKLSSDNQDCQTAEQFFMCFRGVSNFWYTHLTKAG
jgi:hypothetical protein